MMAVTDSTKGPAYESGAAARSKKAAQSMFFYAIFNLCLGLLRIADLLTRPRQFGWFSMVVLALYFLIALGCGIRGAYLLRVSASLEESETEAVSE